ncbi:choline/ethanolamine kinase family protein [Pasteurella multocida]|uniref:choline/ethanolamine kinase family protein n=1 Tax=Pasteurella multocida TaxID=747 RepID=UPI000CE7DD61|nr:choline/ethanolamine kinase family protein [Pasteurella multocida]MCL7818771.1 phosphotransferase family protein [Pasteurella multocida]MDY0578135.1 phosphotransferase family protein [Pasteurella multocida]MEB3459096.1 choline/ethanolamine kinase family protein [Pasteurella multocida]MEB3461258.1 choline/ethanolamine kinase family protein [Pasteurella multocida]PPE96205.1 choline kinase [Pasteurella multocida]
MIKEQIINLIKNELKTNDIKIETLGGMTNRNFLVEGDNNKKYVLRIPGNMTSSLINRKYEKLNSLLMSEHNFNVKTKYFNDESGIKITYFLENSFSLDHSTIKNDMYLKMIAERLYKLHNSNIKLSNKFDVLLEFKKYLSLLKEPSNFYDFNENIREICIFFEKTSIYLIDKYNKLVPCHNDLVPENILIKDNRIYFIDWEYSGMNHPLFDIAAFFLESKLLQEQQESFLKYYNNNINFNLIKNDIIAFQFTQDVLWFLWTIIKEENNEFFDGYAKARIDRAYQSMLTLQKVL